MDLEEQLPFPADLADPESRSQGTCFVGPAVIFFFSFHRGGSSVLLWTAAFAVVFEPACLPSYDSPSGFVTSRFGLARRDNKDV